MSFSIRDAAPDDLDSIMEIESRSFPKPWSREQFLSEMSVPFSKVWVMTDDETDQIVSSYLCFRMQAEACSVLTIAVALEFRGQGHAEKLLRKMVAWVVREEYPQIVLEVRASNRSAQSLYEKLGFKKNSSRPSFYSDGEDALIYVLKTSDAPAELQ
jgi:[ribosomal protein S18]-alanine N-acetyltransferase